MVQVYGTGRKKNNKDSVESAEHETHIWGAHSASALGILEKVKEYLRG